jgi:hypothetical protein
MRSFSVFSIAIAIALTGCSGTTAHVPSAAPITAPHAASPSYTVTAILEAYPDGTARACRTIETSLPGECGSSVLISHLGSARLPFDHVARTRGAYFTPIMQLIGTWTGTSLALTAPPLKSVSETDVMKVWSATKPPSPAQMHAGYPTAAGFRDQQVLLADNADLLARGILVLENGFGAAGLYITVAVGDPATVDLLRSRYRVQEIDSWLSPTP